MEQAALFIVATPIGNMDDITLRAIQTLKEVDYILAEDTRQSSKLLKRFNIEKELFSYHKFNEHKILKRIINELFSGRKIALISDAGTPGISDPGFLLIREAIANGIKVEILPGATAFVPALLLSGLPTDKFVFEGFLPEKKGRKTLLEELKNEPRTMIFYVSPHKLQKDLMDFKNFFGEDRLASLSREITKIFEETIRGTLGEIYEKISENKPKGEMVLVIEGKKDYDKRLKKLKAKENEISNPLRR